MKVAVLGLWHLGTVTAACLAAIGHDVVGCDGNAATIKSLREGNAPVFEPGLGELVTKGLSEGRLSFTDDATKAVAGAEIVWITYDTPVDDDDRADVDWVVHEVERVLPHLADGTTVLISSQLPVGTTRRLERQHALVVKPGIRVGFAYSPENLRLGRAIEVFTKPDRVVIGVRDDRARARIEALLRPITERIEWMSVESAEMSKHAINAFLAVSVTFINELAEICEDVGADAKEVERALKSEARIGPKAYLSPGAAFAGGTLARDVWFLSSLGERHGRPTHLVSAIKASNDAHRSWAGRRLERLLGEMRGSTIAVWGLTYKPGTDTLRRSSAIELCVWLLERGVNVRAHDPVVRSLPRNLEPHVQLCATPVAAARGARALVVGTEWPEYRSVDATSIVEAMASQTVLDAGSFLKATLGNDSRIHYVTVGGMTTA
jgi:UDPglucose 6-dehydrogenase